MKKALVPVAVLLIAFTTLWVWRGTFAPHEPAPGLVLVTLDTTRADYLGVYGSERARTPVIDDLAGRGVRFSRAISPSPLTLPAHASLMTGLDPPAHGLLDNGVSALDPGIPTLASALGSRGYATGAFVSSRVLDRRFGLDSGFGTYDDFMPSENLGEYGYPERDAEAVTSSALSWVARLTPSRSFFLWIHYYDPHAPYEPPPAFQGQTPEENYAGEIAYVDQQIGRLLSSLESQGRHVVVAVVGDHGESLGEHGERTHGIFLYRAVLEVPLILAGPGVPAGIVIDEVVGTRRLASTLLRLVGAGEDMRFPGTHLPGLAGGGQEPDPETVYSATWMPANTYGWSPLRALSGQNLRFILSAGRELYDFVEDPAESRSLVESNAVEARRWERELEDLEKEAAVSRPDSQRVTDPELLEALRSLGYLSGGASQPEGEDRIDPRDGIEMLQDFDRAKQYHWEGDLRSALRILLDLTARNPRNVPFLTHRASVELASGQDETALSTYREAVALNPRLDFLHLNLADALRRLGRLEEARKEYETVLELNPRSAAAWLALAEMAENAGDGQSEYSLLTRAVQAGTASSLIRCRLGQIEAESGNSTASDLHFHAATELTPGWSLPWLLWGREAERRGQAGEALTRFARASDADPANPLPLLSLGRLYLQSEETEKARTYLEKVREIAPESPEAREASALLQRRP